MTFLQKIESLLKRYHDIQNSLATGSLDHQEMAKLSKEFSDMETIAKTALTYKQALDELKSLEALMNESHEADFKEMIEGEFLDLKKSLPRLEHDLKVLLLPKDEDDDRNAILEVRAGTGGDEAGLFASHLLRMYQRYAEVKGWKVEVLEWNETGVGGVKEASMTITGKGVFSRLKFESGVHRVQRVPETEANGRIHTSAATVAVLPEVEDVDIDIRECDLRIDTFRAQGAGGQHVNTTDSAVRITHIPTGVVVSQQDEKSQHKNKAKALKILRARIYDDLRQKRDEARAADRKGQIGSGDRSERIRTYNFPQGRVTDHRIGLTLYKIDLIMNGTALDEVIEAIITHDQAQKLGEVEGR